MAHSRATARQVSIRLLGAAACGALLLAGQGSARTVRCVSVWVGMGCGGWSGMWGRGAMHPRCTSRSGGARRTASKKFRVGRARASWPCDLGTVYILIHTYMPQHPNNAFDAGGSGGLIACREGRDVGPATDQPAAGGAVGPENREPRAHRRQPPRVRGCMLFGEDGVGPIDH